MNSNYQYSQKIDDLLLQALRIVNGYTDGETPDPEKVEQARQAFNNVVDELEVKGVRLFRREWRQRIFEDSSFVLGSDSQYYRCIKNHQTPSIGTWITVSPFQQGDKVFPSVRNGYYYICTVAGTSEVFEPTFPANQDEEVVDGNVTWKAVPDTEPVEGKNYSTFWIQDSTGTGSAYEMEIAYRSSGDFYLKDDELDIIQAVIRQKSFNDYPVKIIHDFEYMDGCRKYMRGIPDVLYIEQQGIYQRLCHLDPIPSLVGAEGYILHYQVYLKNLNSEDNIDVDFPDNWFLYLKWAVASELGMEYSLSTSRMQYIDLKVKEKFMLVKPNDSQNVTERIMKSCF